jgi:hypothetical protein
MELDESPKRQRDRLDVFVEYLLIPLSTAVTIIGVVWLLLRVWGQ